MENIVKVRLAQSEELKTLLKFEQGIVTAERPFNPTLKTGEIHYYDLAELIESSLAAVYIAELGGEIVASGYVLEKKAEDFLQHEKYAHLGFMYVVPEHRGKGINQLILDALMDWAKVRGLTEFRLKVYSENAAAINAYRKAGFASHLLEMRLGIKNQDELKTLRE